MRAVFKRSGLGYDRAAFFMSGPRLDVCFEGWTRERYAIHCKAEGDLDGEVCLCGDSWQAALILHAWNIEDDDFVFVTGRKDVPDLDWVSHAEAGRNLDRFTVALDWRSLDGRAFLEHRRGGRTIIIDSLEDRCAWEGMRTLLLSDCHVEEGRSIHEVYSSLGDVEFDAAEVEAVADCLFDEDTDLETLKKVLALSSDFTVTIGKERYSALALACVREMSDECISYLVHKGLRFSVVQNLRLFVYEPALERVVQDLFDSPQLARVLSAVLSSGYRTSVEDLFSLMDSFIDWSVHFDHLVPIGSSDEVLDEVRCRQFDTLLPFLPEDVFSFRDCCGDTLLSLASGHLGRHRVLEGLFRKILDKSPDVNFINEDGHTALDCASDGAFIAALLERGAIHGPGPDERKSSSPAGSRLGDCDRKLFSLIDDCGWNMHEECFCELADFLDRNGDRLDRNAVSEDGTTVFMSLMWGDFYRPELYDVFLTLGYDVNSIDADGENAFFSAVRCPDCHLDHVGWLLDHGADWRLVNAWGETIFHQAARLFHCKEETWHRFDFIRDKDIFLARDCKGHSPLHIAFEYMNMPAISYLMENGCVAEDELEWIREQARKIRGRALKETLICLFHSYGGL
ncbi:MAG: hypothetical protein IAC42_04770 [Spirochaetes bacterium]|uniref:Ankyrin repeat protein n=1 Tax=Candidatus Aphodenecus pullistercoris TaxID=2840669 RepID=A0A9D9H9N0_9SPIR|nr:hypothetical protein [Candidatus Aphodenecus pullistercoris]